MKAKPILLLITFLGIFQYAIAQQQQDSIGISIEKPVLMAQKITKAPRIDADLGDECWKNAPEGSNFVSFEPRPGFKARERTIFKIVYDDEAVYVSAYMYDSQPDKIARQLSARDQVNDVATDFVHIGFDTYQDKQNGFRFTVGVSGAQGDMRLTPNNWDSSWDAVWDSKTALVKDGWVMEMRIPYSALRFPKKDVQNWGFQFARYVTRQTELSSWSPINPAVNGIVNQWGTLEGLRDIKPPLRLALSPYVAGTFKNLPFDGSYTNQSGFNGGMDLKYGINESFTLDMTLVPDFGQVQSDNLIRNLSPFEVQYEERRPFFTEGTELFSKGNIFYSRRVGGRPMGYWSALSEVGEGETLTKNPSETQLYNATKVSGRTASKTGIGIFNAVTAPIEAIITNDETGATRTFRTGELTNYNVFVLDQLLPNNSSIGITNASTIRNGDGTYGGDANVTALNCVLGNKKNTYQFTTNARLSQLFEPNQKVETGYTYALGVSKVSGNLTWNVGYEEQSARWNPNDLGIFQGNNFRSVYTGITYSTYQPKGAFQQTNTWAGVTLNRRVEPNLFQDVNVNVGFWGRLKNNFNVNGWIFARPIESYDYFEPRVDGLKFHDKPFANIGLNINSDYRKKFTWGLNTNLGASKFENNYNWSIYAWPSYRFNDHFNASVLFGLSQNNNNRGWSTFDDSGNTIFGRRDVRQIENSLQLNYVFNPKMNISCRMRHYWNQLVYQEFYALNTAGDLLTKPDFHTAVDENYNVFNVDFVYTWQFAPGSFLNFIWKNNIFEYDGDRGDSYFNNINKTFDSPQTNTLTMKMIYYLDFARVTKVFRK